MADSTPPQDPFEVFRRIWGPLGLPVPGMAVPTLDPKEVDKRLAELRSVASWLQVNLNMVNMAIQGLEMQRAALLARYAAAAARYIELNPVRAGLAAQAWDYPWSSARAHLNGSDTPLVTVEPLLAMHRDWHEFLTAPWPSEEWEAFRRHERTGRPMGTRTFVSVLERASGRELLPRKRGRKKGDTIPISDV